MTELYDGGACNTLQRDLKDLAMMIAKPIGAQEGW